MFLPPENDSCSSRSDNLGSLLNSGTCCLQQVVLGTDQIPFNLPSCEPNVSELQPAPVSKPTSHVHQPSSSGSCSAVGGFAAEPLHSSSGIILRKGCMGYFFRLNKMQRAVCKDSLFSVKNVILERKMLFLD